MKSGLESLHTSLDAGGVKHVFYESPGTDHEWQTWRRDLTYAPIHSIKFLPDAPLQNVTINFGLKESFRKVEGLLSCSSKEDGAIAISLHDSKTNEVWRLAASLASLKARSCRQTPDNKPAKNPSTVVPPVSTGNLKQRAVSLSNDILVDLYEHGWSTPEAAKAISESGYNLPDPLPMPKNWPERRQWQIGRSNWFCQQEFGKAAKIQQELASLHLADDSLDDAMRTGCNTARPWLPQEIEEVGKGLKRLADQLP